MRKVDLTAVTPVDITESPKLVVPMPEPIEVPASLIKSLGQPEQMWVYRTADGSAYGAVARWNPEGRKKEVRPIVWDGNKFVTSGFGPERPLFNSDMLAARPMAPVLVVEGEKAVDGAAQYVPDGWVVTTWQGGSNAWQNTDWSPLAGHRVVIWPDNDGPGVNASAEIQAVLAALKVPNSIVQISSAFPDGWDLGDELPEKYTGKQITALLKKELKAAQLVDVEDTGSDLIAPTTAENDDPDQDPARKYRPLGYDETGYYIMTDTEFLIGKHNANTLMSERGLVTIHGDREFWAAQQYSAGKRIDWIGAGLNVMNECRAMHIYDTGRMRGRGVWMDKDKDGGDRAMLHTGRNLFISRPDQELKETSFVRVKSPWIYTKRKEIIHDAEYNVCATDEEGRLIRELCQQPRWSSELYGDLLAGWIATAIVCGGMDWRPHLWVTGNHATGKSTIIDKIVKPCMGKAALYPKGATTEAGIRSALQSDAIPVAFDESETEENAKDRLLQILSLMRQASSEGNGAIFKGSANHVAHEFNIRSAFMLVSIGVNMKQGADLSRIAVLSLRAQTSFAASEKKRLEERWNRLLDINSMLPLDLPQKLIARQTRNLFALRHNIAVFKQTITNMMNSPRLGDQLGTLLAGSHSLYSTQRLNESQCEKYLARHNLNDFTEVKEEQEDLALLRHLCVQIIRTETNHGVQDRAVGELLRIVINKMDFEDVTYRNAVNTLGRYGLRAEKEGGRTIGIWLANKWPPLDRLVQTAQFSQGWVNIIKRHHRARQSESALRFGGSTSRATMIPVEEWPLEES
jgi:putative DNA primase/helicase